MNKCNEIFSDFIKDESGLTAVEYAIAGSLVAVGLVTAFTNLGTEAKGSINCLEKGIEATTSGAAAAADAC